MPEILLGLAALVGVLVLLRLFVTANPSTLVRAVRYAGVVLFALAAAWLSPLAKLDPRTTAATASKPSDVREE